MSHKSSAAHLLREYETVFLIKPDVTDETVEKIKERLRTTVAKDGGKVIKFTHWGKKKTAFPVVKQPRAFYLHVNYLGASSTVAEVERNLAIIEDVTKYMTTKIAEGIDPASREVEEDVKLSGDADERPRADRDADADADADAEDDKNDDEEAMA
jgi:ribosomal protein S6